MTADLTRRPVALPDLPPELEVRRRRVAVADGSLAVAELGAPQAPAWVLAHGMGSSARFMAAAFAAPVVRAGWRLVAYDLRGHGASSPARRVEQHHLDVHAADLASVVASVAGPVTVVGGVSLGAHAAVRAASNGVVTEMVLACLPAWIGTATPGRGPHAATAARIATEGTAPMIAALRTDEVLAPWLRATLLADYPRHDPASLDAALRSLDGAEAPSYSELRGLRSPLVVLGWPDDPGHPLAVARRWADLAPRSSQLTLTIRSLDVAVTRLGAAAVKATGAHRRVGSRR